MNFKKILATASALCVSLCSMAVTAFADEPTVYGQAGLSFQVRDSWEHRDAVSVKAFNETGETELNCVFNDVNILGNGQYTVTMEGWACDFNEALLGWLMVDTTLTTNKDDEGIVTMADYPEMTLTIDSFAMDGKEYSAEGLAIGAEQNNSQLACWKIVNSWGQVEDPRGMDNMVWATPEVVSITFTVAGLPTDKPADATNEVIEVISGTGLEAPAPEEPESSEAESSEPEGSIVEDSSVVESTVDESSSEAEASSVADSSSKADEEEGSKLPFILGICAGVVVAVAAVVVIKKRK